MWNGRVRALTPSGSGMRPFAGTVGNTYAGGPPSSEKTEAMADSDVKAWLATTGRFSVGPSPKIDPNVPIS